MKKVTVDTLQEMKQKGEKIASLTAYDYSFAHAMDQAGVDVLLVGDSLGMVIQGHPDTLSVTLDDVIYHTAAVRRGRRRALILGDMPFGTFQCSKEAAFANAARMVGEGGAQMVKLEGGEIMGETTRYIVDRGIPVCGHLGLTPQSVNKFGGFRVQGRGEEEATRLLADANILQAAGAKLLILEAVPNDLANEITSALTIPVIGIGAGPSTDGQVLVMQDALGIYPDASPRFSRNFMDEGGTIHDALKRYVEAVKAGHFPGPEHGFE